jgi:hypothetical protein
MTTHRAMRSHARDLASTSLRSCDRVYTGYSPRLLEELLALPNALILSQGQTTVVQGRYPNRKGLWVVVLGVAVPL